MVFAASRSVGNNDGKSTTSACKVDQALLRFSLEGENIKQQQIQFKAIQSVTQEDGIVVNSVKVNPENTHVVEIDVTSSVQAWINDPDDNVGIEIVCKGCQEAGVELKGPGARLHIRASLMKETPETRFKRAVFIFNEEQEAKKKKKPRKSGRECANANRKNRKGKKKSPRCCRDSMIVNFDVLGGYNYILAPRAFEAHVCRGRCPYRATAMATIHARLQSLIAKTSKAVPRPCCVPSSYAAESFLHVKGDDSSHSVVTRVSEAIVSSCTCA